MKEIENEVAPHRRKKGKKHYSLQCRLTPEGFERKMKEHAERLKHDMKWSGGYSRYERLKDAEHAFADIARRQKNNHTFWGDYHRDREYRIIDDRR